MNKSLIAFLPFIFYSFCASCQPDDDAIFRAAKYQDCTMLADCIKAGISVNTIDADSAPPFLYAARNHDLRMIKLLFSLGADMNMVTNGKTVLEWAKEMVKRDIFGDEKGIADFLDKPFRDYELLFAYGFEDIIIEDLKTDKLSVNESFREGKTCAHLSVLYNDESVLNYIIDSGALLNAPDSLGRTPLHYAILIKNVFIVKDLIYGGVDVNFPDEDGETPLFIARRMGNTETCNTLAKNGAISQQLNVKPHLILSTGHIADTYSVCFSPDGQYALSGRIDGTVKLWDMKTGVEIQAFKGHNMPVYSVCFSPDGCYALSGSGDNTIKLWDVYTGKEIRSFEGHSSWVSSVCFSPDGYLILSASDDQTVRLWSVVTGEQIWVFSGHNGSVVSACFSPDGLCVLTASMDSTIILWDLYTHKEIRTYKMQTFLVNSACFSPDGSYVLSVGGGNINLWETKTGKELRSFKSEPGYSSACFSNDGRYILSAGADSTLRLWDIQSGKEIRSFEGQIYRPAYVCFSPDGKYVLSAGVFSLFLWDAQSGKIIRTFEENFSLAGSVSFSVDGNYILWASGDETYKLWNLKTGKEDILPPKHSRSISSVCFSPDNRYILAACFDTTLKIWDMQSGKEVRSFKGHKDFINSACFSPDGRYALSSSNDKTLKLWDVQSGKKIRTFKGHTGSVNSACFSPDGQYAISASEDATVKLWDVRSGKEIRSMEGHAGPVRSACFSREGNYSLAGNDNSTLKLWDIKEGSVVRTFRGHTSPVTCVGYSDDGLHAFSADNDNNLILWDVQAGKLLNLFKGYTLRIISVYFSPGGRYVFSASADNLIKIWDVQAGKEIATLISVDKSDWMILTPDQYYFPSKNALKYLYFRVGNRLFSFDQFDLKYNRPDIVLERIGYAPPELIDAYRKAYYKRLKKMGFTEDMLKEDFHVPEIEILDVETLDKDQINDATDSQILELTVKAADSLYLLDRLNVLVNDIPIYGMSGIDLREAGTNSVRKNIKLKLSNGKNKVQVSALNQAGAESLKETIYVEYQGEKVKPDLYLAAIGVSEFQQQDMNLKYSVKDGRDLVNLYAGSADQFAHIYIDTLFNREVTKENVLNLKEKLMKSRVDDQVILFLSGHGLLSDSLDFYFATWDMDFMHPEKNGILYDDIEGLLDGIPARKKLLLIDACHSGEVDKEELVAVNDTPKQPEDGTKGTLKVYDYKGIGTLETDGGLGLQNSFELMQELFTNLSRGSGAVVISAAAGKGFALEGQQWNNGVFTYALLNGIKNLAADEDYDEEISVTELKDYVISEVEAITNGAQKPTCRRENLEVDWRVW